MKSRVWANKFLIVHFVIRYSFISLLRAHNLELVSCEQCNFISRRRIYAIVSHQLLIAIAGRMMICIAPFCELIISFYLNFFFQIVVVVVVATTEVAVATGDQPRAA